MLKIIPVSAALLLSVCSAYAQNGSVTTTTPDNTITNSDTVTTPDTSTTTVSTPNGVTSPNGVSDSTVTTTPVTTTPSPVITTTPGTVTTAPGAASSSSSTTVSTPLGNAYTCTGVNPDWNLTVSKNLTTYSSSKDPSVKIRAVNMTAPMGDATGNIQTFTAKDNNNRNVTIIINKNATSCSNAPSGQSYSYDAFIVFPNQVLVGCCNPR